MTKQHLAHFKELLLKEKERLTQEISNIGEADHTRPGHFTPKYPESGGDSPDDNAAEVSEYADELSVENRLEEEIRDVEKALKAIEDGTYGICKYCNEPIDEKRLEARPASSSCINCKKILTQEM